MCYRKTFFVMIAVLIAVPGTMAADDEESKRLGLGLGVGIVKPNVGDGEFYGNLSLRIKLGDDEDDSGRARDDVIRAYVEPEIGFWKLDESAIGTSEDMHLGVNLLGYVPAEAIDFWIGFGIALHSFDTELVVPDPDEDDTVLGGNLQLGIEANVTENVGIFGVGRMDLLEGTMFDRQTKISGGIRIKF